MIDSMSSGLLRILARSAFTVNRIAMERMIAVGNASERRFNAQIDAGLHSISVQFLGLRGISEYDTFQP